MNIARLILLCSILVSCNILTTNKTKDKPIDKDGVTLINNTVKDIKLNHEQYCIATESIVKDDHIILLDKHLYWNSEKEGNHIHWLKSINDKNARSTYVIENIDWIFEAYQRLRLDTLKVHKELIVKDIANQEKIVIEIKNDSIDNRFFIDLSAYNLGNGVHPTLLEFTKAVVQNKPYLVEAK